MPFNKPLESNRFHVSPIGLLLGLGFVLYVYRFPLGAGNISVLRVAMLILGISLLIAVAQSKRVLTVSHWVFVTGVIFLSGINIYYYPSLDQYPIPQTEIIAHVANMLLMLEILVLINSERQLILILNGYILMALVAIGIAYYGFAFERIPFEDFLRANGPEASIDTPYVIQDGAFLRFSGSFMDPNFFGIYLLSVITFAIWLYLFRGRNKIYLIVALLSLTTLPLTLSRTAMIGFVVFFGLFIYWLREKHRALILTATLFLCVFGVVALLLTYPALFDRWLDAESAYERVHFISKGFNAFMAHPLLGSGPASIIDEDTGIATTHLMYLSILAKFGLIGAAAYLIFVFYPLGRVIFGKRMFLKEYRLLIIGLYVPLFFMYFLYDFLTFLEFEYFVFAVGYSVIFSKFSKKIIGRKERCMPPSQPPQVTSYARSAGAISLPGME